MDSLEMFLLDHARVHAASLTDNAGGLSVAELAVRNLTDDQWRLRPHGLNSLAWIIWHIARFEDAAVNVMVAGQAQVFHEDGWADRLGVQRVDAGTEMTSADVDDFSRTADIPAIRDYRNAVGGRTRRFTGSLRPEDLDSIPPTERLERHSYMHLGQGRWVKRLILAGITS